MTLGTMLSAVYEEMSYQASPAAAVTTRITRYLNEAIRSVLGEPCLQRAADSDDPYTFASVAAQARYVLPEAVARIHHFTDRTNDIKLNAMDLATYRRICPDPTVVTGTPDYYVPIGKVAVAVQPADASELFVASSAGGDTTQGAYVEGIITGGYRRSVSTTLTGVTAVTLNASVKSFIEIEDFYLSAAATGTVTLTEDSGAGAELARITIGATRPRYYAFYLWPTPTAAVTYYVD